MVFIANLFSRFIGLNETGRYTGVKNIGFPKENCFPCEMLSSQKIGKRNITVLPKKLSSFLATTF